MTPLQSPLFSLSLCSLCRNIDKKKWQQISVVVLKCTNTPDGFSNESLIIFEELWYYLVYNMCVCVRMCVCDLSFCAKSKSSFRLNQSKFIDVFRKHRWNDRRLSHLCIKRQCSQIRACARVCVCVCGSVGEHLKISWWHKITNKRRNYYPALPNT